MKTVHKLVVIISLLATSAAFAANGVEQAYIASYQGRTGIPVPLTVVSPQVGAEYAGVVLRVDLTVEPTGEPADIRVINAPDSVLAGQVAKAMAKWRFAPAERDGQAVAMKVEVPIQIVAGAGAPLFAAN